MVVFISIIIFLPVLVISRLHPVEGLLQGLVAVLLIVHLLDLEAVGQVLKLHISVLLNCQLGVRNGLKY